MGFRDTEKYKSLTDKQRAFLEALAGDAKGDPNKAKEMAGYEASTNTGWLISSVSEFVVEIAQELLAHNSIKAVKAMIENLDTPGRLGGMTALNTAKELLDRVGIIKKEEDKSKASAATIIILPVKNPETE